MRCACHCIVVWVIFVNLLLESLCKCVSMTNCAMHTDTRTLIPAHIMQPYIRTHPIHTTHTHIHIHRRGTAYRRDIDDSTGKKNVRAQPNNKVCIDMLTFYQILCKFAIGACCYFFGWAENELNDVPRIDDGSHTHWPQFGNDDFFMLCYRMEMIF